MSTKTNYRVVIPARLQSSRLTQKPLQDLGGSPLILRVIEQVLSCSATEIWVAVDDTSVADVVSLFLNQNTSLSHRLYLAMTDPNHPSGTDRLAELALTQNWSDDDVIVNVQGDEPLIPPQTIEQVAQLLADHPHAAIATLSQPIVDSADLFNPNIVKVVTQANGQALYFSRAPIPFDRDNQTNPDLSIAKRHIGLYAYRAGFLKRFTSLSPSALEQQEKLEQLRALWYGFTIMVADSYVPHEAGVDTPEDLTRVRQWYINQ
jgi:3-deoxy-manno-octulosonate cytidylyltransferase (CMP-KDO synthetase)